MALLLDLHPSAYAAAAWLDGTVSTNVLPLSSSELDGDVAAVEPDEPRGRSASPSPEPVISAMRVSLAR